MADLQRLPGIGPFYSALIVVPRMRPDRRAGHRAAGAEASGGGVRASGRRGSEVERIAEASATVADMGER